VTAQTFPSRVAADVAPIRQAGGELQGGTAAALGLLLKRFEEVKDALCLDSFEHHLAIQRLVRLASACQMIAEDLGWAPTTSIHGGGAREKRAERAAAYLYGLKWSAGQPSFEKLPPAARRQWLEDGRKLIEVLG
jgi:hypothetical protein